MTIKTQKIIFQYPETAGLISIVICVYNSGKYLERMLDSIYAQTYKKIEVIVAYDTKSTDNSLDILKHYSAQYGLIIDYGDDSSLGFARARGARLARGEFFIHFDGDDVVVPTYLEDLHECFVRYPDIKIAYGGYREVFEENLDSEYHQAQNKKTTYVTISARDAILSYYRPFNQPIIDREILGTVWVWLVKRQYLQDIGYYSPDITMREDNVYVSQLLVNSTKIGYSSNTGYLWICHPKSACHKQITFTQEKERTSHIYEYLKPIFINAGYENFIIQQEKMDFNNILIIFVNTLRNKSYPEFKAYLARERITNLPVYGSFSSKLSSIGFNVSKRAYWTIHRIRRFFHTQKKIIQCYIIE